jgi:predicted flap endonuclease-1-like 5' DNA nuclease
LGAAGITTYAALADSSPEQLAEITRSAGVRAGDFNGWIAEAKLRAAGKRVKRATRGAGVAQGTKVSCPQDLSRIDGIGSVYETRLYAAGIGTYWELTEIADQDLVRVLEVQDFQTLDIVVVKAAALKLAEETDTVGRYWDGTPPDDFEKLEGIGEVYERRLYDAGICTFRALAEVSEERLQEICQAPDWRRPDYASWIAQAQRLIV